MKRSYIARRFQSSGAGLTLDTAALAKYKDIVDLSIGDTDFTTDESIINAAFRDAKAGHTHYGDPKGDPELIDAVCRAWEEDFGQRLPRDHVLVSASSCLGMSLAMFAILDPGDEVIVFSPYFPMYRTQIELAGGVCVDVPTYAEEDYAIGMNKSNTALLEKMQTAGQPWAVSSLAQAAGLAALDETAYVTRVQALIAQQRPVLRDGLRALGLRVLDGSANYLLFQAPETLGNILRQRGIVLRSCGNYPGLDGSWYRTAVRTAPENQQLIEALREVLA